MSQDDDGDMKVLIPKPRILVCAPSNAGVDEIITRVMQVGLIDGNRRRYNPDIIRIGRQANMRRTIDHLSLDVLVEVRVVLFGSIIHWRCCSLLILICYLLLLSSSLLLF
jgi:hypothetical protein